MTSDTSYILEVSSSNIERAIHELSALDSTNAGDVVLTVENGLLTLTRKSTKKETAQTTIEAHGHFPFSVQCKWERFSRLAHQKEDTIQIILNLNSKGKGNIRFDGMSIPYEPLSQQFSLPFTSPSLTTSNKNKQVESDFLKHALQDRLAFLDIQNAALTQPIDVIARVYERDAEVVRIIKILRGSSCQICGHSFLMTNGGYYSECHHLAELAKLGLDVSENILVLCANHHRQFHFGIVQILDHTAKYVRFRLEEKEYTCEVGVGF